MAKRKDTTPVSALRASQLEQEEKNVSTQQAAASKQDERKQREAQKGPVSVLKAEQLNSAAQSGRAVSAQLTEQEFNRSTALQKSYGNYLNYTLGRKVTGGGFYSRPGIGQDQLDSVERLKLATQNYQQAMVGLDQAYKALRPQTLRSSSAAKLPTLKDAAGGGLTLPRVNPIPEKQTIRNNVNPALDQNLQNQFHNAYALASAAEDAYREAESNYQDLTRSAEEQDKAWKSTIRDQASIQADIDEIDRQISELWRKRNENDRTMVGTNDPMGVRNLGNAQYLTNYLNAKGENERIDKLIENLRDDQNLLREELEWSHYFQWSGYRDQQIPVSAQRMGILKKNQQAAQNDPMYTILTGEGDVGQAVIARENPGSARTLAGEDLSTMAFISDEERETYKAIYEQRGPEVAAQYYRELKELSLNTRRRQAEEAEMRSFADSAPVTASVASILAGPMQAVAYVAQAVDMLDGRLERDAAYNRITYLRNAARGEIAKNFQDNLGETWGKFGSFGYQTAMSMGDFLFNAAITGGFSGGSGNFALGLMGTEAAADATMQALDRGLSDKQAFALGTVAGLAEVVTEKVSLEALLDKLGMEQGFRYFLKNVFAEGSEELGSDIINLAADAWISKDRSEWQQAIRDYQTMGKTREEAFRQAWIDQLMQTGASFLGGALSGGAMAGGSLALNAVVSAEYNSAQGEAMLADENEMQRVISQGLESPADSEAYKRAKALQEKLAAGQTVTPGEAGRAYFATQDQVYKDLKSQSAEIIGRRLMVPDGDAVLKNAIGVGLEIEETRAMAERMADKYMDGTLTAKDAGEIFLATQKALDAQAKTEQEIAEREQSAYEAAELLGVEIELFDQEATTYERDGKVFESTVNGYFDRATGKIRINRNAADPIMQVVSHELTHGLEQTESYSRLMDIVREQTPDMDSAIRERVERYQRAGVELTDEDAVHEIVAEYVQKNLLNDEKTIRAFAKRDRSLAGWILRQIDKVLAKLGDTNAKERVTLEKARGIYAEALREVQEDGRLRLPKVESGQAASVTETESAGKSVREDQGLRDRIREIVDQLDFAQFNGLSAKEIRQLNGQLYKAQAQLDQFTARQRGLVKQTSINDIISNIGRYDRMDLESLAEQVSDSAWDDYEELSDSELREALVDALKGRFEDLDPGDADKARYGFWVKPPKAPVSIGRWDGSKSGSKQLSITERESSEYKDAVDRGDMETAQRLVDEAAKKAGYDSPKLYHGTPHFGFTKIDTKQSDDGLSFFTTSDLKLAQTYSGKWDVTEIGVLPEQRKFNSRDPQKILQALRENNRLFDAKYFPAEHGAELDDFANTVLSRLTNRLEDEGYFNSGIEKAEWLWDAIQAFYKENSKTTREKLFGRLFAIEDDFRYNIVDEMITQMELVLNIYGETEDVYWYLGDYHHTDQALSLLRGDRRGNYAFYGKTDGLKTIEGRRAQWFNILVDGKEKNTRQIAREAYKEGFLGVRIKEIIDNGGRGASHVNAGDVYVYFDGTCLKSADPVTYDDDGNVIPLEERFNSENKDIRYDITESEVKGLELPSVQAEASGDASLRDAETETDGRLRLPKVEDNILKDETYTMASRLRYDAARKAAQYMIDNARDEDERAEGRDALKAAERLLEKKPAKKAPEEVKPYDPIESRKRLTNKLIDTFQVEREGRAGVRQNIEELSERLLGKGYYDEADLGELYSRLRYYGRGTIPADPYYESVRETLKGKKLYLDKSTRVDFGDDYGHWKKRAAAVGIYFTTDLKNRDARDMIPELNKDFPGIFKEDMTDPRDIIETMVENAELGMPRTVPMDEYEEWVRKQTGQSTEEQQAELWQKVKQAVDAYLDAANVEQILRGKKNLQTKAAAEPEAGPDFMRDIYQMSDAEIDNYINLMEEPVRTETDLLDRVTEPENGRKIKAEDAPGAFLEAIAELEGNFGGQIPGMDQVSTGILPAAKQKNKGGVKEAGRFVYRKMVDSGEAVTRLGKYSGDNYLYHFYNMARASSNAAVSMIQDAQTNVRGEKVGESLNDIFKTIRDKGDDYYRNLELYLYHMHNVDRMSREEKAAVQIKQAQEEMEQFKKDNPEFANMADFQIQALANDPISTLNAQAQLYSKILDRLVRASMIHNKPVFGLNAENRSGQRVRKAIEAPVSQYIAAELYETLKETEGFEEDVQNIYSYIDRLMRYRIDSGLITEEDYRKLKEIYPHYVPVFYEVEEEFDEPTKKQINQTQIGKTIGNAEGSIKYVIMPLHRSLAKQTFSVVREGSKNRFGTRLLDMQQSSRGMITDVQEYAGDFHEDTFDDEHRDDEFKKTHTFIVREDGKRWEMTLDNAMYEAVDVLSPEPEEVNLVTKVIRGSNELFKALCTGYNPTFLVRNFMRDLQDAGLYSKDLSEFAKNYPLAVKEIAANGKYWQQYKALGGLYSSIFDYQTGELKQSNKFKRYTFDKMEAVNMAVEQAPRLTEFMATVKKAEKAGNLTMDTLMEAMYNAADVTVNFGRSGKIGKYLNRNFVPFLNPGIQGFDKMIRNVTETRGFKNWARLTAKATLLGIAPAILSRLLFGKRKDWDEIKQRDKDIYYLFPLDDNGHWLKLPKGRTLSIFGMATDRVMNQIEGKDTDWIGLLTTSLEQTAPANPLTNNIWQPIVGTKLFNPDNPGETWYGTDIESKRLQNLAPEERYDASTSKISKFLGRTFKLSPAKINYLLDQYSGVLGDIILPLTSARAEKDIFSAAFTVDTETSNRLSGDFYEKLDELTYQKNDPKADPESAAVYRYFNKASSDVSEINKVIRSIEEDESLSDKEKRELTRVQYALRNEVMRNALENVGQYAETAKRTYAETGDGDEAYRAANREMFGAEYALRLYDKSVYETAQEMNRDSGIEYENFYQFYFSNKEITAEGAEGTRERIGLIRQQNIEDEQKRALYEKYVSNSDETKGNWDFITGFGISADEYLDFKAETHDMNQGDTLRYLADADMSEKTKLGIVATVKGETTLEKPDGTQTKMGKLLEMADEGVSIDDGIRALAAGGLDEYDKAMKNGLNPQAAMRSAELATQIKEGAEIKNSLGYCIEAVQTIENDQDMLCAMAGFMDNSEFEKVRVGMELDVEPRLYVEAKARVQDVLDEVRQQPGMENKGLDQEIAKQALDAMSCSNQEKAVLWQLLHKSWKPGKNPYGNGNAAYDALHRTEEEIDGTLRLPSVE